MDHPTILKHRERHRHSVMVWCPAVTISARRNKGFSLSCLQNVSFLQEIKKKKHLLLLT